MRKSGKVTLGLLAVLFLLLGIALLVRSRRFEAFGEPCTVVFYYLPGCGWCEKAKPEWKKFEEKAKSKGIITKAVNAQENQDEVASKGIRGFPTFMLVKEGKEEEYSGDRTAEALMQAALKF